MKSLLTLIAITMTLILPSLAAADMYVIDFPPYVVVRNPSPAPPPAPPAPPAPAANDNDGVANHDMYGNTLDNCPTVPNGFCSMGASYCDVNRDGAVTATEREAGNQRDSDGDRIGDACDDSDSDGVMDYIDNCPTVVNPTQDASLCYDTDDDEVPNNIDNCQDEYNADQADADNDGLGDMCDNCRTVENEDQLDTNLDGRGDVCSIDDDNDGIIDEEDNCPLVSNVNQRDTDDNGTGDLCDEGPTPVVNPPPPVSRGDDGSCALVHGAPIGAGGFLTVFFWFASGLILAGRKSKIS